MRIYTWNVNGLRSILKKGLMEFINDEDPDILCLQETKLQEEQIDDEIKNLKGYYKYFSFANKKGYSGVAIFTKVEPKNIYHGIGIEEFDTEGRILIAEYEDFILFNIYFPNGKMSDERLDYKLRFYDAIMDYSKKLLEEGKNIIICGDYNTAHREIDLKNPKQNEKSSGFLPIEREYIDRFLEIGFIDAYRHFYPDKIEYTWWSYMFKAREKNVGWRIDYFFVSNNFISKIKDVEILTHIHGSDHCPVKLTI
ncbi:exodeoxyribonuclease III [Caloramator sp. Dgby_cultured_2]|uniref:exodeoxyribonuclease III n=1 Tax=Caloramator sp. Dgby_cultured_2 TaxID=3029174 RepID=UPI00237D4B75|nr:exodeoxyribonuclease III [Caloramator sp. Dgby_cultured_2]WDU82093.1 exodeoxyribonuclease III [Caloramator sp. Dgby_cultured_2]